jgi:hypothetical protein
MVPAYHRTGEWDDGSVKARARARAVGNLRTEREPRHRLRLVFQCRVL